MLTHGTNWTTIAASHAPKRTTLALKNRYSTLRLRHENANKSKENTAGKAVGASPSSSEGARATSKMAMSTNQKVGGYVGQSSDDSDEEAQEDEEDEEDEDGEDDENEDGDEENGDDDDDDGEASRIQVMSNSDKTDASTITSHTKDPNTATSGAWSGFTERSGLFTPSSFHPGTSPISTENWPNGTADHAPYESPFSTNHPSLYVGCTSGPYSTYGRLAPIR